MERDKFDNIVDTLLQPVLKSHTAKMAKYNTEDAIRRETSIRLAPKPELKPCEDCADLVANRVIHISVKMMNTNYPFWEKKCLHCDKRERVSYYRKKEGKKPVGTQNAK